MKNKVSKELKAESRQLKEQARDAIDGIFDRYTAYSPEDRARVKAYITVLKKFEERLSHYDEETTSTFNFREWLYDVMNKAFIFTDEK